MARPNQNFPEGARAARSAAVLTVTSLDPSKNRLRAILQDQNYRTLQARNVQDAVRQLRRRRVFMVVVDGDLSDGSWRDLLLEADRVPHSPLVVVTATHADELLWGEVLNLGGFDVLAQPFDECEIKRTADSAWRHWQQQPAVVPEPAPVKAATAGAGGNWLVHSLSA